jgi:Ca-activated chloride channel homolog
MSFQSPWFLFLVLLPAAWAAWQWRSSARRAALLVKALAFALIALALAEPRLTVYSHKVGVAILADTSLSVPAEDLKRATGLAARLERARGGNWTRVIPFARSARQVAATEMRSDKPLAHSPGTEGRGTNLEAAIREGIASMPSGVLPRVVLISDGNENLGSATRAIWQARQLGVPVDTMLLDGRPEPALRVLSVSVPAEVFSGERFPMDVTLSSPRAAEAKVEITAEGKPLGSTPVQLSAGANHFRVHSKLAAVGAIDVAGKISAPGLGDASFEYAVTLRRPKALFVSDDPAASEAHMVRLLEANQFTVEQVRSMPQGNLDDYQLAVFNNQNAEAIPAARKAVIEEFVRGGGGLLWIAGERNVYVEKKGPEDPLARALPAKLAPPRTPEGTCVVLIVDKSSSMEGKKIELARLAAIGVVDNLRPIDQVGVLIFDNSFQWAVPVRKAEDRTLIKRLISGVMADGGTQIAPALSEGFRRIVPVRATHKHIVLLTDGISEEGDSLTVSREAANNRITISTVGLGQDVNRAYLEKVAMVAKGKSYFLSDPSALEQILLKDVQEHTGTTAVEKPVKVVVTKPAEILEGVGMENAPPLRGFIRYISKPTADTMLKVDEKEPLLVRWQYELGRVAVFTSDAKNRWASAWITWDGFDRFWANMVHDLLPRARSTEASAQYDDANDELVVDYRLGKNAAEPAVVPDVFVFGPGGFQKAAKVAKVAAGTYRLRTPVGGRQGLFRVRPLNDSKAFPEVGFYREEDELTDFGGNAFLMREIASATGGRFNPQPSEVFDPGGRAIATTMELWPGLLALALLLNLAELVMRKWKGLVEGFRHPVATSA